MRSASGFGAVEIFSSKEYQYKIPSRQYHSQRYSGIEFFRKRGFGDSNMGKLRLLMLLSCFLPLSSVADIMVGFDPQNSVIGGPGSTGTVAIVISGLGAPSHLSTFDLNIFFDPTIIDLNQLNFTDQLGSPDFQTYTHVLTGLVPGNPGTGDAKTTATLGASDVGIANVSLLLDLSGQPGSFTLASLTFTGLAPGTSALNIVVNALGDESGNPLTATVEGGSVLVTPEPGSVILLASCLGGIALGLFRKQAA